MSGNTSEADVFAAIVEMLADMLSEFGIEPDEIAMGTEFHDDLEMESIDLVGLAGLLRERYGTKVNFADFIAGMELEEIMHVTVGQLVTFVVDSLATAEEAAEDAEVGEPA